MRFENCWFMNLLLWSYGYVVLILWTVNQPFGLGFRNPLFTSLFFSFFFNERCYFHNIFYNIFTTNHRLLVVIGSNLNLTLRLLFYPNNNNR